MYIRSVAVYQIYHTNFVQNDRKKSLLVLLRRLNLVPTLWNTKNMILCKSFESLERTTLRISIRRRLDCVFTRALICFRGTFRAICEDSVSLVKESNLTNRNIFYREMPAIKLFGRKWLAATDDLVYPGLFEIFIRTVW